MIKRLLAISCLLSANAFSFSFPDDDKAAAAMQSGHYAEAYCNWKPLAKRGDANAQYNLGWLYANGLGMHVDPSMAAYWWRLAASQDHHDAQFALGFAIVSGDIDSESIKEATDLFIKAADSGHEDSREMLAKINLDSRVDLIKLHPELIDKEWFGWQATVTRDRINVREKPSTKSKIVGKLTKTTKVHVIGRKGDWLQIKYSGDEDKQSHVAWVYRLLLTSFK